jgi:hypothetical protein
MLNHIGLGLLNQICDGLVAAQEAKIRRMCGHSSVGIAKSKLFRASIAVQQDRPLVSISAGMLGLIAGVNHTVLGRGENTAMGVSPLWPHEECVLSAVQLTMMCFGPDDFQPAPLCRLPLDHPYTQLAGALCVGQWAFLIGHELAHYLLGHLADPVPILGESRAGIVMFLDDATKMKQQEVEADRLAGSMTKRYVDSHDDLLVREVGVVGPAIFFQWMAVCETLMATLFAEPWASRLTSLTAEVFEADPGGTVYAHLHGHPLGSERLHAYVNEHCRSLGELASSILVGSGRIAEQVMADAREPKRYEAIAKNFESIKKEFFRHRGS